MDDIIQVYCYLYHSPLKGLFLLMTRKLSEFLMAMRATLRVQTGGERFLLDVASQKWLCVGAIHSSQQRINVRIMHTLLCPCWVLAIVLVQPFI